MLPADLRSAEAEALTAIEAALATGDTGLWTVEFRFEGLRLLPLALRLLEALNTAHPGVRMLLPDAGATALAKRDAPDFASQLASLRDQMRLQQADGASGGLLLLVGPTPADYEEVEQVCALHRGLVLMLNGSLEDAAVGIGSVARERRRGFLADWQSAYALIPLAEGALRRAFPAGWQLYRRDPDGHRFVADFEQKPDAEQRAAALAGEGGPGLAGNLQAIESLIEGLRH
ncbi:conserved hypothetical protein [Cyanobium sp. PCC 7001]|uniref:DUF1995 family protein n=1 Tax=Cyanobium sp. PCC 7001 TaxID=180281 RepID=UPI00018052AE|nr:DUF1995 family protein [Cyanobium sp. PCC 7001]EDY39595.1 conserved hypothetical protein [Cyanobium sp. PCC 7001]